MSDEKPTVEFEKPPAWAISMMERQQENFAELRVEMESRFDRTDANIEVVSNDLKVTKDRVALLESRADTSSIRARQPSEQDVEISTQLAQERAAREALAKDVAEVKAETIAQTQIMLSLRDGAKKLLERPEVKWLAAALWMAFTAWLATKGIK